MTRLCKNELVASERLKANRAYVRNTESVVRRQELAKGEGTRLTQLVKNVEGNEGWPRDEDYRKRSMRGLYTLPA